MSVGFGFSVGDFLSALSLVGTVIDSLRTSGSSSSRYRSLITELYTLEDALIRVKRVELDDSQSSERIALEQAAADGHRTIDGFMKKIEKYQPHLKAGGSGNRVKDAWMKIRWAVCKSEDVDKFRAELIGHRGAIEVLLLTLQMSKSSIQARAQEGHQRTLSGKIQDMSFQWIGKLSAVADNVTSCFEQGKHLLEVSAKVLRFNVRIFQMTCEIHKLVARIPGQVERQQPVFMIDALGKSSPFHLEFVRSAEALKAVLKVNLKHTETGPQKIERGEFIIQESHSQGGIDLNQPWENCFFPGQKVTMAMIFQNPREMTSHCPRCDSDADGATDQEIECNNCGITYCRVVGITKSPDLPVISDGYEGNGQSLEIQYYRSASPALPPLLRKRKRDDGISDDVMNFRRVRLET